MIYPAVGDNGVVNFLVEHLRLDVQNIARCIGRSPDDAVLLIHLILSGIIQRPVSGKQ
jgi:hypothetical protein